MTRDNQAISQDSGPTYRNEPADQQQAPVPQGRALAIRTRTLHALQSERPEALPL